jgi:hypothetical protein
MFNKPVSGYRGRVVKQKLVLSSNFIGDQIHNNHCHEFSHTLSCYLSQTWMFNKLASGLNILTRVEQKIIKKSSNFFREKSVTSSIVLSPPSLLSLTAIISLSIPSPFSLPLSISLHFPYLTLSPLSLSLSQSPYLSQSPSLCLSIPPLSLIPPLCISLSQPPLNSFSHSLNLSPLSLSPSLLFLPFLSVSSSFFIHQFIIALNQGTLTQGKTLSPVNLLVLTTSAVSKSMSRTRLKKHSLKFALLNFENESRGNSKS